MVLFPASARPHERDRLSQAPVRGRLRAVRILRAPGMRTRPRSIAMVHSTRARRSGRSRRRSRRLFDEVEQAVGSRARVGARMELRGQVPQRQVELGREHENGERRLEADPPVDEADSDGDCDERDAERGSELEHGSGEEGHSERAHRGPAVLLADLRDALGLDAAPVERPECREPADHVEEVRREQHECLPPRTCLTFRVPAHEPHEQGHERQGQEHDARRDEVDSGDEHKHCDRDDEREHDLRQVAGEGRLERIDSRDCSSCDLGATGAIQGRRPVVQPSFDHVEPKLREHVDRRAPSRDLESPDHPGRAPRQR